MRVVGMYLQQLFLLCEAQDLGAHDAGAGLQGEDGTDEGLRLALPLHHGGDLDNRVLVRLREDPCGTGKTDLSHFCLLSTY